MRTDDRASREARTDVQQTTFDAVDAEIEWIARGLGARGMHYPALISRAALEQAGYTESFPHLLMTATKVDRAAAQWCLSPAVCYHVYEELAGTVMSEPLTLTARGVCFRGERDTAPGVRQVEFEMREIVFIGPAEWVLAQARTAVARVTALAMQLGLDGGWHPAEDPFFLPAAAGKALMQRLLGVKDEYRSGGPEGLALASVNRHGTFFGDRFAIRHAGSETPVDTACVAIGLDRWCAALVGSKEGAHVDR
jgi:hypothetical protein